MPPKTANARKTRRNLPKGKKMGKTVKITKTVRVKPMKDTAKAQVLSLMRKMIGKDIENKEIGNLIEDGVAHNSAIGNGDLKSVLPEIASGTDGSTRLGDRIKPKSLRVYGTVGSYDSPDTRPIYVRVVIASQKDVKVGSQIGTATDPAHLLRTAIPGASEIAFSGNRNELLYFLNDNKFRVHYDKTFLIAQGAASSGQPRVKDQFEFSADLTSSLPANLHFDEGNGDWANNYAPFFAVGYAYADGGAPDTVTRRISVDCYSKLSYEDA